MSECAGCDVCGRIAEDALYGNVDGKHYCSRCWKAARQPFPKLAMTQAQIAQAEIEARQRMLKRGGADRHIARSGRS